MLCDSDMVGSKQTSRCPGQGVATGSVTCTLASRKESDMFSMLM